MVFANKTKGTAMKLRWIVVGGLLTSLIISCSRPNTSETAPLGQSPDGSGVSSVESSRPNTFEETTPPQDNSRYYVTSDRLNRRTCPSVDCGVVGRLYFRDGTQILEHRNGWVRISKPYWASCVNGRSEYVDSGNAACDPSNGIVDGQFSEWVFAEFLSEDRPPDPAADASGDEALVGGSDDFRHYRIQFAEAARSLIDEGRCTEGDFREMGGWIKSTNYRDKPIYFTYCGGLRLQNKIHLNAKTGEILR